MLANKYRTDYTEAKIGRRVVIFVAFASLVTGTITKVGRLNVKVLADGHSGVWTFNKKTGEAAPGIHSLAWILPLVAAKKLRKEHRSGVRRPIHFLHTEASSLFEGAGSI